MVLPSCCLGVKDILIRVLTDHTFLQSESWLEIKPGTPPLFRYSRAWLQVRVSPQPPPAPAPSAFWPLWCPAVARDVQSQRSSEKGLPQSNGGNAHKLLLPLRVPACLSKLDHFWLSCLFSALKLKQEILNLKEGHLVVKTEVSQGSNLGQILEYKQMSIISTEGLEWVFPWKTNKSDFLCISSEGSEGLRFLTVPDGSQGYTPSRDTYYRAHMSSSWRSQATHKIRP